MKALDLFCGAGGASRGLADAGFDVHGVDLRRIKQYPYAFTQADAMKVDLSGYDLIWASPPCQGYSVATQPRFRGQYKDFIPRLRNRLKASGALYIIENVVGAPLRRPITLCGTMFGLGVIRHRLFEVNFPVSVPKHEKHAGTVITGEFVTVAGHGGVPSWTADARVKRGLDRYIPGEASLSRWNEAMGIDWMLKKHLVQAIPPAYAALLGAAAAALLRRERATRSGAGPRISSNSAHLRAPR